MHLQVQQLRRNAVASSSSQASSQNTIADLQRIIDEITGERDSLESDLSDARAAAASAAAARDRAEAEVQRAEAARAVAHEQLEQLRVSMDGDSASAAAADARAEAMQVGFWATPHVDTQRGISASRLLATGVFL